MEDASLAPPETSPSTVPAADEEPEQKKPVDPKIETKIALKLWKADIKTSKSTREKLTFMQRMKLKCCQPKDEDMKATKGKKMKAKPGAKIKPKKN